MNDLINTDDIKQLEHVRNFLSDVRREYNEYKADSMLKFQAFSNVIHLLALKIEELGKEVK